MKHIKEFDDFLPENRQVNEYELEIDNEYSKVKKVGDHTEIELGDIDAVSNATIDSMKKTYPHGEIKIVNGKVILKMNENIEDIDINSITNQPEHGEDNDEPTYEPEDCEECKEEAKLSGIEYEQYFSWKNGSWYCNQCGRPN